MEVNRRQAASSVDGMTDVDNELPKPESCRAAGLECRPCAQHAAWNLAQICQNLGPDSVREAFFKIYPDHACLPMARTFARAYRTAQPGTDSTGLDDESPEYEIAALSNT